MDNRFLRTRMLFGEESFEKLKNSTVMIFGLGGVGGYVAEAVARSGVGHIIIIDNDTVDISNINRQVIALNSNIGQYKADLWEERIKEINPEAVVEKHKIFFLPGNHDIIKSGVDYIVDAVDTITAKIEIIMQAKALNIPVISSMGTGFKTDPSKFEITDIYKTSVCPLAKVMRYELKKRGIKKLTVVYSKELPRKSAFSIDPEGTRKKTAASCAFVPSSAGLLIASKVIRDLADI